MKAFKGATTGSRRFLQLFRMSRTLVLAIGFLMLLGLDPARAQIINYFRLGEGDSGAAAGNAFNSATADSVGGNTLSANSARPIYSCDTAGAATAATGSYLSALFYGGQYLSSGTPLVEGTLYDDAANGSYNERTYFGCQLWLKVSSVSSGCVFYNGTPGKDGWGLYVTPLTGPGEPDNTVLLQYVAGGAPAPLASRPNTNTFTGWITVDQWYLVTVEAWNVPFVNNFVRVIASGPNSFTSDPAVAGLPYPPSGQFSIGDAGGTSPPSGSFFNGVVDELSFFNFSSLDGGNNPIIPAGVDLGAKTSSPPFSPYNGTTSISGVSTTGATLNAPMNPYGNNTTVNFQYGTTLNYGGQTSVNIGSGTCLQTVTIPVTGLTPNTTYHGRSVVTWGSSVYYGPDMIFTTGIVVQNYFQLGENDPLPLSGNPIVTSADAVSGTILTGTVLNPANSPTYACDVSPIATKAAGSYVGANFNGTQYLTAPLLNPVTDNFCLEAWVKPAGVHDGIIAYNGSSAANGWGFIESGGAISGIYGGIGLIGSEPVTPGAWAHVALVRNNGVATFYINGVAIATSTVTPGTPTGFFGIGSPSNDLGDPALGFNGEVDQVRFFTFSPGFFNPSMLLISAGPVALPAPKIVATQATSVGPNSATLSTALLPPGTNNALMFFQYGLNTAYGLATPTNNVAVSGVCPLTVWAALTNLSPNALYHFRAVVVTNGVADYGLDEVFITATGGVTPQNYFQLGEDDFGATPDQTVKATIDPIGGVMLTNINQPVYACDVSPGAANATGSRLSVNVGIGCLTGPLLSTATNNFGLEGWFKPTLFRPGISVVAFNGDPAYNGIGFVLATNQSGGSQWEALAGGIAYSGGEPATLNAWVHLAVVCTGNAATFYINGTAIYTVPLPHTPTGQFWLGSFPIADLVYFTSFSGEIDQVRLFTFNPGQFNPTNLLVAASPAPPPQTALPTVTAPVITVVGAGPGQAALSVTADPNGADTKTYVQYGPTAGYGGYSATNDLGAGTCVTGGSATLSNLTPGQVYHDRAVAENSSGQVNGVDQTFVATKLTINGSNPQIQTLGGAWNDPGVTLSVSPLATAGNNLSSLVLKGDGTVVAWGNNQYNQTNVPAGLGAVVGLAGLAYSDLVLLKNGTVTGWGDNADGELNPPANLTNAVALAGNPNALYCLALKNDGTVAGWGLNTSGQINLPPGLNGVTAIAAGYQHGLALKGNGAVVAWGANNAGQATVPTTLNLATAIAAGDYHSLALLANGTVVAWGTNNAGQTSVPAGLTNVVAIAAGGNDSAALRANGTVVVWGDNSQGQLNVPAGLTNVVAITAGEGHFLALTASGNVVGWGLNSFGQTTVPAGLTTLNPGNTVALGTVNPNVPGTYADICGTLNYLGLITSVTRTVVVAPPPAVLTLAPGNLSGGNVTLNGSVNLYGYAGAAWFQWGTSTVYSQTTTVTNLAGGNNAASTFNSVIAGLQSGVTYHYRALATNSLGQMTVGQDQAITLPWITLNQGNVVSTPPNTPFVDPGATLIGFPVAIEESVYDCLALKSDGTIEGWGLGTINNPLTAGEYGQAMPPAGLTNVIAISAGYQHSVALTGNGTVTAWGYDADGETNVPADLNNVVAISARNASHTLALKNDGTVVGWGLNTSGQTNIPAGLSNVVAVATGAAHSLALKSDGSIIGWGDNSQGEINIPAGLPPATAIAGGLNFSIALLTNGTVAAWGVNNVGQTNVPAGLTNVVAIAAGWQHSLALLANGTVVAWGYDAFNQAEVPPGLTNVVAIAAGYYASEALLANGTIVGWGQNYYYQIGAPADLDTLSGQVGVTGTVNVNMPGFYTLTYTTTNYQGATYSTNRTVVVIGTPEVTTLGAGAFQQGTLNFSALVNPLGAATTVYFQYGADTNYGSVSLTNSLTTGLAATQTVTVAMSNLTANAAYHFRAVAVNSAGVAYGNDVAVVGDTPPVISPPSYSLQFNGVSSYSYVSPASASLMPPFSALTIELWFQWADSGSAVEFLTSMGLGNYEIQLGQGNNGVRFIPTTGVLLDTANNAFAPGQWVHLACVYSPGTTGQIYINGVAQPTTLDGGSLSTPLVTPTAPLRIGTRTDGSYPYNGLIDEVRIWNTARTAAQIQANYQQRLTGSQPGLVAYYPFPEGSGTTTADASGNGYDSTLFNGVTWSQNSPLPGLGPLSPLTLPYTTTTTNVAANVRSQNGNALTVIWSVASAANPGGVPVETNFVPAGAALTGTNVTLSYTYPAGTNWVSVTVSDSYLPPVTATNYLAVITTPPPPDAPTGLMAGYANNQLQLTWNVAGGATSYLIQRATVNGGPYTTLGTSTTNSYVDTNAVVGTYYYYVVSGVNTTGTGANSSQARGGDLPPVISFGLPYALQFNGANAYVSTANATNLPAFSALTLELWFQWADSGSDPEFLTSMGVGTYEIQLGQGNNGVRFIPTTGVFLDTGDNAFTPGQWVHIACVYDPNAQIGQIYINGVAQATSLDNGSLNTPLVTPSAPLQLGLRSNGTLPYNGLMGEVAIWNVARTAAQVQSDYQQPVAGSQTNLVLHYIFAEGSGGTTADASGNTNNGTLFDGVTWVAPGVAASAANYSLTNILSGGSSMTNLNAIVSDTTGAALTAIWSVNGTPQQTNAIPAGNPTTFAAIGFTNSYAAGTNLISLSVSDGLISPAVTNFTVIAPVILTAGTVGAATTENQAVSIPAGTFLQAVTGNTGPDTLLSVTSPGTNGGVAVLSGGSVLYTPAANRTGLDLFNYTVSDTNNVTATGNVQVYVASGRLPQLNQLILISNTGAFDLRFAGTPGHTASLQNSTNLISWQTDSSQLVPDYGILDFIINPTAPGMFYRIYSQ